MRVLVTGGLGFIGSHVVDELVANGHDVVVLDLLHPAAHGGDVPEYANPAADARLGDIRDLGAVSAAVAGVDSVCHLAAMVGLGVDPSDVTEYVSHNDLGTATLLRALHESRARPRLVLGSSMVVYGEGSYTCPEHGLVRPQPRRPADLDAGRFEPTCSRCAAPVVPVAITEDAPADPRNTYAVTKLTQEHLCSVWARGSGNAVTALRFHNVYGPRMPFDTPYAGVASLFRSALEHGCSPRVFEDGRQLRDFVHVRDVAHACALALQREDPVPGAVNICSGTPRSIAEMADALADATAGPRPRVTGEYRLGDVRHVFADPERARRELGFVARVDFHDGIREFATAPASRSFVSSRPDEPPEDHDDWPPLTATDG